MYVVKIILSDFNTGLYRLVVVLRLLTSTLFFEAGLTLRFDFHPSFFPSLQDYTSQICRPSGAVPLWLQTSMAPCRSRVVDKAPALPLAMYAWTCASVYSIVKVEKLVNAIQGVCWKCIASGSGLE